MKDNAKFLLLVFIAVIFALIIFTWANEHIQKMRLKWAIDDGSQQSAVVTTTATTTTPPAPVSQTAPTIPVIPPTATMANVGGGGPLMNPAGGIQSLV